MIREIGMSPIRLRDLLTCHSDDQMRTSTVRFSEMTGDKQGLNSKEIPLSGGCQTLHIPKPGITNSQEPCGFRSTSSHSFSPLPDVFQCSWDRQLPTQISPSPSRINPFPWSSGIIPRDLCPACRGVDTHTQNCLQLKQKFLWNTPLVLSFPV